MRLKLINRVTLTVFFTSALAMTPIFLLNALSIYEQLAIALVGVCFILVLTRYFLKDLREGISSLETGLLNLKDGEFASTLSYNNDDELGYLCRLYNQTALQLREEKHWLYQRELLLDKVTQSSPEVLFLLNDQQQVVFSNIAARRFFNASKNIDGSKIDQLVVNAPAGAEEAIGAEKEGLFSLVPEDGEPQTWHMSTGQFLLNNQAHTLFILKQMTRELSRQEVAVWKKVIRVISHELNNSLGPISSMLHSGKILSAKLGAQATRHENDNTQDSSQQRKQEQLNRVFSTIDDRIKHLSEFVQGYGKFAKLPEPKLALIKWADLIANLADQWQFTVNDSSGPADTSANSARSFYADPVQLEQLLINLLKNAHESGSAPEDVAVDIEYRKQEVIIQVLDRGKGISDTVMSNALIPFYSTKPSGSGLGLALCREIIDAHHGQIGLYNRDGGGLAVRVALPM
ncbi:histidine kinase [Glaciecola sp. MH2013]|uniref:sensor histidine kinase n=1 Tax=Glaciecola sp. MH2013 TaxID=2785524 RepID=UPI00189F0034|nr:ATP-binding protein [Glaciecola sp. MH2013]MBF7074519.1 histidine kinase [Glaciecola sp. MH2013]